jgi:hypothetical protein
LVSQLPFNHIEATASKCAKNFIRYRRKWHSAISNEFNGEDPDLRPIPSGSVAGPMLEPDTRIGHAAVKPVALTGTLLIRVSEAGRVPLVFPVKLLERCAPAPRTFDANGPLNLDFP